MRRTDAFPSKFVSKDDVESPVVWTIATIEKIEMDDDTGGKKSPPVVTFHEPESKPLILNNTNWMVCEDLYGEDSDMWIGKSIELYKDPSIMFGGKRVGGVRVRKPANGNGADALKALRERIRAEGGNPPALHPSDIDTPEKINNQIALHQSAYAELLAKTI